MEDDANRLLVDELEAAVTESERRRRAIKEDQDSSRKKLENEANRLLTERQKLLEGTNLAERILRARGRRTQEGGMEDEIRKEDNENAVKESLIKEGGRMMVEGGIEHGRRKEEHEEADEMRRLAKYKERKRERQMHMEREKERDKERDLVRVREEENITSQHVDEGFTLDICTELKGAVVVDYICLYSLRSSILSSNDPETLSCDVLSKSMTPKGWNPIVGCFVLGHCAWPCFSLYTA
jgi:hypothetical protein